MTTREIQSQGIDVSVFRDNGKEIGSKPYDISRPVPATPETMGSDESYNYDDDRPAMSTTKIPSVRFASPPDFVPRPEIVPIDAQSTSGETAMTGTTTQRLIKVVKSQVNMVKSLTTANMENQKNLEKLRREKRQMEEMYKKMRKQLQRAGQNSGVEESLPESVDASWTTSYKSTEGLPPPPPLAVAEEISIATPFTTDTDAFASVVLPRAKGSRVSPALKKTSRYGRKKSRGEKGRKKAAPLPEATSDDHSLSCSGRLWASFAFACTFLIPDCLISKSGRGAKQAWREKVAICMIVFLVSCFFVGFFGFLPLFFCSETDTYTFQDIWSKDREAWTVIHGDIYDMKDYINVHPGGSRGIVEWLGKDSSKMFPRLPPARLPEKCLNSEKDLSDYSSYRCEDMTELDELVGLPCHRDQSKSRLGIDRWLGDYKIGSLAFSGSSLINGGEDFDWIVIRDRVYNVTKYIGGFRDEDSGKIAKDSSETESAYLAGSLHSLIVNKLNEDATDVYDQLYANDDYIYCLDKLFYAGVVDTRSDPVCHSLNIGMYVLIFFVALILVLQCLCSLLYLARPAHAFTKEDSLAKVMVMVPCYNEGDKELRKTINSVIKTKYTSENKIMVVVADGNITGRGESLSTPKILSNLLEFDIDDNEDASYSYRGIGAQRENRANIYSGILKRGGKKLKYLVIVKCGVESEVGGRAGNRGKRDSQLIITGLFNRVHHNRPLCDLDAAISRELTALRVPANQIEYLMTIDADTRVHEDSVSHMVYNMNKNEKILALCGETRVDNKAESLITMLQVFEYYTNHHMKKAFESVFGCVTCLPGCFTMYRCFSSDGRSLISQDKVFGEYARNDIETLHEKNLYLLGEDRMLTTLLLKNFPEMRLSFVPEAVCWTVVPHTFWILLSQRRRWINSTFHNMIELLKVKTMCGICCFSMKTIVVLDLIATMILPASMIYAGYFVYLVFVTGEDISLLMLILYGVIMGVQVVIFLLRSRWDYLFWFLIFMVVGVPLFYLVLPIYSFCKMDDFSWGHTRQVRKGGAVSQPSRKAPKGKERKRERQSGKRGSSTSDTDRDRKSRSNGNSTKSRSEHFRSKNTHKASKRHPNAGRIQERQTSNGRTMEDPDRAGNYSSDQLLAYSL